MLCIVRYFIIVHNSLLAHSCVIFKLAERLVTGIRKEVLIKAVAYRGGFGVFKYPFPEIPKAIQNRANLNPIVKTVKNC